MNVPRRILLPSEVEKMAQHQRQQQFQPELSPLEKAFSDYQRMEQELTAVKAKNEDLLVTNMNLLSEVQMLREALERADADRIRLQAGYSTLLGRLFSINEIIGGAVSASIRDGVDAVKPDPELEKAAGEAAAIIQRLPARDGAEMAPRPMTSPRAPQAVGGGLPPIDWQRLPQG